MSNASLNVFQTSYRRAIELSKVAGIVWLLQATHDMRKYQAKKERLRALPTGTIGRSIAGLLDENQLDLIPRFESHDLKHVLLGYGMTPEDEIRMQAFLLGNGNHSLACLLFLSFGLLMPEIWPALRAEFRKGRNTASISHLTLENAAHRSVWELRLELDIQVV